MTVDQDKHACAFATKECPACKDGIADRSYGHFDLCNGSGRVRVLTGVTEKCRRMVHDGTYPNTYENTKECVCHGLGEVPTDDLEKWLEAIALRGWRVLFEEDGVSFYREESLPHVWQQGFGRPFHALLSALKQALVADGAELGQIKEGA